MSLRDLLGAMIPALAAAGAPKINPAEMKGVLEQFRNDRADDIAALADRAGRSGARLAMTQRECGRWKAYARDLERLCLAAGLEMPPAPDDGLDA